MIPLVATACSTATQDPTPEPAAKTPSQVLGGVTDHTNMYPFVGTYAWDSGGSCSGILVTPAWMLTANHCVMGDLTGPGCGIATGVPVDKRADSLTVSFLFEGLDVLSTGNPLPFAVQRHTPKSQILVRVARAIDQCNDSDVAKDLALIQLDKRIPMWAAAPLPHLPGVGPEAGPLCSQVVDNSDFTATLIGYGGGGWRNFLSSSGWERQSESGAPSTTTPGSPTEATTAQRSPGTREVRWFTATCCVASTAVTSTESSGAVGGRSGYPCRCGTPTRQRWIPMRPRTFSEMSSTPMGG